MLEPITYSVIIPVYNEEKALYDAYKRIKRVVAPIGEGYELIFVDNNSSDRSTDMLQVFCAADIRARAIYLSECFGYAAAVRAGADHAAGSQVMIMDISMRSFLWDKSKAGEERYSIRRLNGFTHSPLWDYVPEMPAVS